MWLSASDCVEVSLLESELDFADSIVDEVLLMTELFEDERELCRRSKIFRLTYRFFLGSSVSILKLFGG